MLPYFSFAIIVNNPIEKKMILSPFKFQEISEI